jgi:RNA polymerase sigma factor (sigma-70 family)
MDPKIQMFPSFLNEEGKAESERELFHESRAWSGEEWQSYLDSLDVGLKESQLSQLEIDNLGLASNIFEYAARSCQPEISDAVEKLISILTEKQQFVIRKIFFEGLSKSQIAKIMGVSRQRVFTMKKRAIRQLKNNAKKVVGNFPIVEAQVGFETLNPEMVRESQEKGDVSC